MKKVIPTILAAVMGILFMSCPNPTVDSPKSGAKAIAYLRGNAAISVPTTFVRIEPYVTPKKSLTGGSNERVDTRVLQVLFAFDRAALPIYVGQQMDVFIEATAAAGAQTQKPQS